MNANASPPLERVPSGIRGLDTVLGGGFMKSGIYIVEGMPGSGKTILANEICFRHIASGGRALYITLLAESHVRLFQHLQALDYFDASVIPDKLRYLSAFMELESGGLTGLVTVLRREIRAQNATLLVLDGLTEATRSAQGDRDVKKFVQELQSHAVLHGCTMFLLTSGTGHSGHSERTMVDGLIELENSPHQMRTTRSLAVSKFRGSAILDGRHAFSIQREGVQVYPRVEARYSSPPDGDGTAGRSTGVAGLDALISTGGYPENSITVVVGSTGAGKTTMGLHFLSGSTATEPGLFFSFYESPTRLVESARSMGLSLPALQKAGWVHFTWRPAWEQGLDELAHVLLTEVERTGARRLVLDGLGGFFEAAVYPERIGRFFGALANELRGRGVTTLATLETRDAVSSVVTTPYGISALVDCLVFLRFVELNGQIRRLFSIIKMRNATFDPMLRTLEINRQGARVGGPIRAEGDVIPKASPIEKGEEPD